MATKPVSAEPWLELQRPWEQIENETDRAYEAFCVYLDTPKRGQVNRRHLTDTAQKMDRTSNTLESWFHAWGWKYRANAYDAYMITPTEIEELESRRLYAKTLRETGTVLLEKCRQAVAEIDDDRIKDMSAADIARLARLAMQCGEQAGQYEQPAVNEKESRLNREIEQFVELLAGGVGKLAAGGPGAAITATERSVRFDLPTAKASGEDAGLEPVLEVPALPGTLRQGSPSADLDAGSDQDGADGEGQ